MRYPVLISVVALACAGCLGSRTYTPYKLYVVDPGAGAVAGSGGPSSALTLGVRDISPARPYGQTRIAYRAEALEVGYYSEAQWAELPAETLTRAFTDALAASGAFADVGRMLDLATPALILTGDLRRFDEVRTTDPWTALCEVRLELRRGPGRELVWAETLTASVPLEEHSVPALAQAMSQAMSEIVAKAVEGIVAAAPKAT